MNASAGPTDFNFYLSSDLHVPVSMTAYQQHFPQIVYRSLIARSYSAQSMHGNVPLLKL